MELHYYAIDGSGRDVVRLVPLGDIHWGVMNCAEGLLLEWVERIRADRDCWWVGMGDMLEAINFTDRRFDPRVIAGRYRVMDLRDLPMLQARELVGVLGSIADRCIGWHTGNHEETILLRYHEDVTGWMCTELGLAGGGYGGRYLENNAMTVLEVRRRGRRTLRYRIYSEHGRGSGRTAGGSLNSLLRLSSNFDADIYLRGHVHQRMAVVQPRLRVEYEPRRRAGRLSLEDWDQVFCLTGTFYRTYLEGSTSYAEQRSYAPTPLGPLVVTIDVDTGRLSVI